MFRIGISEIIIIFIVLFITIKPKDIPGLFRKLGIMTKKIKQQIDIIKDGTIGDMK